MNRKDNVIPCPFCDRKIRQGNLPRHVDACKRRPAQRPQRRDSLVAAVTAKEVDHA